MERNKLLIEMTTDLKQRTRLLKKIISLVKNPDARRDIDSIIFKLKNAAVLEKRKGKYYYLREKIMPQRSYSNDRVTQFLRHIARVLFFEVDAHLSNEYYWCELGNGLLIEVQVMLVEMQRDVHKMMTRESKLYVSYNTKSCVLRDPSNRRNYYSNETNKVKDIIKVKLEELLCSGQLYGLINSHSGQPPEYKEGDSDYYYSRDHSIYKLRKHRDTIGCKEIYHNLLKNYHHVKNKIEIEEPPLNNPGRHAEEQLCDRAIRLKKAKRNRGMTFQICGKKRPCKSCAGRMKVYGFIDYNQNSGYFFMDSLWGQLRNSDFPAVEESLILLLRTPCFKSAKDSWSYSYDTDSDSDQEIYEEREVAVKLFEDKYYHPKKEKKNFVGKFHSQEERSQSRNWRSQERRKTRKKKGKRILP